MVRVSAEIQVFYFRFFFFPVLEALWGLYWEPGQYLSWSNLMLNIF